MQNPREHDGDKTSAEKAREIGSVLAGCGFSVSTSTAAAALSHGVNWAVLGLFGVAGGSMLAGGVCCVKSYLCSSDLGETKGLLKDDNKSLAPAAMEKQ